VNWTVREVLSKQNNIYQPDWECFSAYWQLTCLMRFVARTAEEGLQGKYWGHFAGAYKAWWTTQKKA